MKCQLWWEHNYHQCCSWFLSFYKISINISLSHYDNTERAALSFSEHIRTNPRDLKKADPFREKKVRPRVSWTTFTTRSHEKWFSWRGIPRPFPAIFFIVAEISFERSMRFFRTCSSTLDAFIPSRILGNAFESKIVARSSNFSWVTDAGEIHENDLHVIMLWSQIKHY